ncbi:MAG TPA: hypothetical protein VGN80_19360 [Devosiaceae bacterium]|jgi:hypothetical protein|nr:hypothetical protein [Devosiaceae bacterium]
MSGVRARNIWLILVGYIAWSVLFVGLYALQALGCAAGWHQVTVGPTDLHRILLVAAYFGGLLALAGVLLVQARMPTEGYPAPAPFLRRAGVLATLAALVSSALIFAPVLAVSACR